MKTLPKAGLLWAVILVSLLLLPLFAEKYYVQLMTKILIMAVFALSLDLLVGRTGLVSLGHAVFFGIAGYTLALAGPPYQAANFWLSLALALGVCAALALAMGLLVLRTSGVYFIMVTLAFAQLLYFVVHDTKMAGGSDGLYIHVRPDATLAGWKPFDLENFQHFYYVTLSFAVLAFSLLYKLLRSLFGRVLAGIRENEPRMQALGYATFRYKLVCFVIAGTVAGLAGYLAAAQFGFVNPEMLGWHLSGSVLMMVILGGMGTLGGPALGACAMQVLELAFQSLPEIGGVDLGKHWQLFMGTCIILVALFLPKGLSALIRHKERP